MNQGLPQIFEKVMEIKLIFFYKKHGKKSSNIICYNT